jgi:hypothetical protein
MKFRRCSRRTIQRYKKKNTRLLAEQIAIKETMTKELHSVPRLDIEEEESVAMQVGKLVKAIQ